MKAEFVNLKQAGQTLEQAVARLAALHQGQGRRVLILARDEAQAEVLDRLLWSFDPASFLPHALAGGPDQEGEPVLIALEPANLNTAQVLILARPLDDPPPAGIEHAVHFVPAEDGPELTSCRERYRRLTQTPGVEVSHTTRLPG